MKEAWSKGHGVKGPRDVIFWLYDPCSLPVAMTIKEIQNGRGTDGE
ncbi:MAG TPA: hypothetical protein VFG02_06850 [Nitrospirota bacterium]|nr:hypothetical protein [Nitrospirota bacterium]